MATPTQSEAEAEPILSLPPNITVRAFRSSDVQSMATHANNHKIWSNLRNRMPHPYTEADAIWWIDHCSEPATQQASGPWTPETGATGPMFPTCFALCVEDECVGTIGVEFKDDVYVRTAEVGYWLGEAHWGKGVMSRVLPVFVRWAFETFGILIRLDSETYEWNPASARVLEKTGFVREGMRRDNVFKAGRIGGTVIWGLLRTDLEG